MNFFGLIRKYPVGRGLTNDEISHQLKHDTRQAVAPHYQLSVVEMNSTYLEVVDKWFAWKGYWTAVMLIAFFTVVLGVGLVALETVMLGLGKEPYMNYSSASYIWNGIAMFVLFFVPSAVMVLWLLRKDSFAFTYYPIRFNRKTRLVHVYRIDGTVLSVPWDSIFFTLGHMPQWDEWEVRGHILKSDNMTVEETFSLGYVGSMSAADRNAPEGRSSKDDMVRAHWEFIRRYMEEGPHSVSDQIQFCMPVADRKESAKGSFERMFANLSGAPLIVLLVMFLFLILFSIGRLIAMRTSKIPAWPREVLDSSAISEDDPYAIVGNDRGERTAVFPDVAAAAGVGFRASGE